MVWEVNGLKIRQLLDCVVMTQLIKGREMQTMTHRLWSTWLLCLAWGLLEAASLFGLGGTSLASIPANAALGVTNDFLTPLTTASFGLIVLAIVSALLGLLASRLWSDPEQAKRDAFDGLWLSWMMLLAITLLVWLQPSVIVISMKVLLVGLTALVLGLQVGTLYQINNRIKLSKVSHRSSVLSAIASYPANLPSARSYWHIGTTLLVFFLGIWLGSELVQFSVTAIFLMALAIMLSATIMTSRPFRHLHSEQ